MYVCGLIGVHMFSVCVLLCLYFCGCLCVVGCFVTCAHFEFVLLSALVCVCVLGVLCVVRLCLYV